MRLSDAAGRAPDSPGVYFFLGADDVLLYVGKAGHLRRRLQQHAKAKPGPRERLAALYQRVADVRWEEQATEELAAVREADFIVVLQPVFNASLAAEGCWVHLSVHREGAATTLALGTEHGRAYGCFPHLGRGLSSRPGIACSDGYAAFLRLLWAASAPPGARIPRAILAGPPDAFSLTLDRALDRPLHAFLTGVSGGLLSELASRLAVEEYMRPALARDQVAAEGFFIHGPRALRQLRLRHRVPSGPMSRATIEALLLAEARAAIGEFSIAGMTDPTAGLLGRRDSRTRILRTAIREESSR